MIACIRTLLAARRKRDKWRWGMGDGGQYTRHGYDGDMIVYYPLLKLLGALHICIILVPADH